MPGSVDEYIRAFRASRNLGHLIRCSFIEPERPASLVAPGGLSPAVVSGLGTIGIKTLYKHQKQAISLIKKGMNVVVATPTASGKTLIYNLPIMDRLIERPSARALYLFPLKALAQDQLRNLKELAAAISFSSPPSFAIYDGDTSSWHRSKIRQSPPNCLFTNPDMLHLSLLPYHDRWAQFWRELEFVVIDEVHTYRGIMGSNMGWVFRRLGRICRKYGTTPVFIASSATIGNPGELVSELTGLDFQVIDESGAPQAERHLLLVDPQGAGAAQTAVLLILAALKRGLRTICYTQSRKLTELISLWVGQRAGALANKVTAYRAGFLPEERRQIEAMLASGELLAVISTSALELGIDIGSLDICILVGYPGTLMSLRQRSGRVGRSQRESAVILVAGEDALDKYFMENPRELVERPAEKAVINITNSKVVRRHLLCAAAEEPVSLDEELLSIKAVREIADGLVKRGRLFLSADGRRFITSKRYPQREVDIRGTGQGFGIVAKDSGNIIGTVDGYRAFKETHPGAIYLHKGRTYKVLELDIEHRKVLVEQVNADYFTRVRSSKETEIVDVRGERLVFGTSCCWGRLLITDQVIGYDVRHIRGQRLINRVDLDLPPQRFETEGLWFVIPDDVKAKIEASYHHFMGGIHALEHACIGIMPLLVLCDRNDLGGISITCHPQLQQAAVFVYDGIPGGIGLAKQAFKSFEELLGLVFDTVQGCSCENGCPSCVHSPKCGSGNRPIDKKAALMILADLKDEKRTVKRRNVKEKAKKFHKTAEIRDEQVNIHDNMFPFSLSGLRFGVLDVETQFSAQEVGGWHRADRMKVSCAVLYDSKTRAFCAFLEHQLPFLFTLMDRMDVIVGFNIKRFDYRVLSAYANQNLWTMPTFDIMEMVHRSLGYRLSLDSLANATLGVGKSGNGLMALEWWKKGRVRDIVEYCKKDVAITRDLFEFAFEKGYLLFRNKAGSLVRLDADWLEELQRFYRRAEFMPDDPL